MDLVLEVEEQSRRGYLGVSLFDPLIPDSIDMSLGNVQEIGKDREAEHATILGLTRVGHDLVTEQQQPLYLVPCQLTRIELNIFQNLWPTSLLFNMKCFKWFWVMGC